MSTLTDRDAVVCGDWNIAHTENDIKNWRGNVKKSGFLPAERQWLTELSPSQAGGTPRGRAGSTWFVFCILTWPARTPGGHGEEGRSTTTPVGASTTSPPRKLGAPPGDAWLGGRASAARVERAAAYALRWYDHAPVTVEYATARESGVG